MDELKRIYGGEGRLHHFEKHTPADATSASPRDSSRITGFPPAATTRYLWATNNNNSGM
jgi:hypothetical protein